MVRADERRDDQIESLFYTPLRGRTGLSVDQYRLYRKDAHGPLCAGLPGLFQYKQFPLAHDSGGVWMAPVGVERGTPKDEQIDGIAELTFTSTQTRITYHDIHHGATAKSVQMFGQAVVPEFRMLGLPDEIRKVV